MKEKVTVPPNHRRGLSITAQTMERELSEIETLLTQPAHQKITSLTQVTYSDEERQTILDLVHELKALNARFFHQFDLEARLVTDRQMVSAKTSYLWTILKDSEPASLNGYGKFPPETAPLLQDYIDRMVELIKKFP